MIRISHVALVACIVISGNVAARAIDDKALADETSNEWLAYGRTYSEQRFSPLSDVNAGNVSDLKVDWYIDLPDAQGLVATPLVSEGVMYFTGSKNMVWAVDATTGKQLWKYIPAPDPGRSRSSFLHGSRGVGLWKDKVFTTTVAGRLIALDKATGEEIWNVNTIVPGTPLYITGAPKIFKGKVLVGNGGTENSGSRGYVTAYDAETGEQAWRFYIVPGNPADGFENAAMEMAAETWTGEWWTMGGGGNAWHGFTYDPEFDALYIGTGNGAPWNRKIRSPGGGDNLFLCSIVALDPDTGEYLWHYQTTPGETWDYNSNMDIVLADLEIDGKERKVIMHAPKNGFFYVIERGTGKLLSAEPYADVSWASKIDLATGRPVEVPGSRYEDGQALVTPGPFGAHNWPPMSYNPQTGLVYIPTIHQYLIYSDDEVDLNTWESPDWFAPVPTGGEGVAFEIVGNRNDGTRGSLQAWDPVKQEQVWEIPLHSPWNPGTLTTAGNLVFQGRADGDLVAYNAETGQELWKEHLGLGIAAPPVTYAINGKQYVSLLVGWGAVFAAIGGQEASDLGWQYGRHMRRLVTFSLEGDEELPALPPPEVPEPLAAPFFEVDEALARTGEDIYGQCSWCHGQEGLAGGSAPDLRASTIPLDHDAFGATLRAGRVPLGMPAYDNLSDEHVKALQHYIREQANLGLE